MNPKQSPEASEYAIEPSRLMRLIRSRYSYFAFALIAFSLITELTRALLALLLEQLHQFALISPSFYRFAQLWLLGFLPLYVVGLPVCLWLLRSLPGTRLSGRQLSARQLFERFIICFPLMYLGNAIGSSLAYLLSDGKAQNSVLEFIMSSDSLLMRILIVVLLAPLVEEFVFRKVLLDKLQLYGEWQAILFSAITFGLFHMNLFQFFYAFAIGLVLAYTYAQTHRLRYSFLLHAALNFVGGVLAPWMLQLVEPLIKLAGEFNGKNPAQAEQLLLSLKPGGRTLLGLGLLVLYFLWLIFAIIYGLVILISRRRRIQLAKPEHSASTIESLRWLLLNPGMLAFTLLSLIYTFLPIFTGK